MNTLCEHTYQHVPETVTCYRSLVTLMVQWYQSFGAGGIW